MHEILKLFFLPLIFFFFNLAFSAEEFWSSHSFFFFFKGFPSKQLFPDCVAQNNAKPMIYRIGQCICFKS